MPSPAYAFDLIELNGDDLREAPCQIIARPAVELHPLAFLAGDVSGSHAPVSPYPSAAGARCGLRYFGAGARAHVCASGVVSRAGREVSSDKAEPQWRKDRIARLGRTGPPKRPKTLGPLASTGSDGGSLLFACFQALSPFSR
jgi:hypothetical protein